MRLNLKRGQMVYFCCIHSDEVYNGTFREATLEAGKKIVDKIKKGKKYDYLLGYGVYLGVAENKDQFNIFVTKFFHPAGVSSIRYNNQILHKIWIQIGMYAKKVLIDDANPSYRFGLKESKKIK